MEDDVIEIVSDEESISPLERVEAEIQQVEAQIEALLARQAALRQERETLLRQAAVDKRAPKADWAAAAFPWDGEVARIRNDVFKLGGWRPLQREVINATLQGRDVLCLMPAGGGKSLTYQLPALVSDGLTLVISPLLSLIQDQVLGLQAIGVAAASLTSLTPKEEVNAIYQQMAPGGALRLMFCTPEKVASSKRFLSKLEKLHAAGQLARVAVDEAHCVSQWGNDFRPDYKRLCLLKQQFPNAPLLALTATATDRVCDDIRSILLMEGCETFRSSVNRPNLRYEVLHKSDKAEEASAQIAAYIKAHYPGGESGIAYVLTRKDAEQLAAALLSAGLAAAFYHADMEPGARQAAHVAWSAGAVQVLCATISFGMGISKTDVRFVIHATLAKSIENYYQESGRCGRDGLPAKCILCYRFSDVLRQAAVVCTEPSWRPNLTAIAHYAAAAAGCRRALIQRHFGEAPAECTTPCDLCDVRRAKGGGGGGGGGGDPGQEDYTRAALGLLKTLQSLERGSGKKHTLSQLLDAFRNRNKSADHGAGAAMSRDEAEWLAGALMLQGYLSLEFGFTAYATNCYLTPTKAGASFVDADGRRKLLMERPTLRSVSEATAEALAAAAAAAPIGAAPAKRHQAAQQRAGQQQQAEDEAETEAEDEGPEDDEGQQQRRRRQQQRQAKPSAKRRAASVPRAKEQEQEEGGGGGWQDDEDDGQGEEEEDEDWEEEGDEDFMPARQKQRQR